MVRPGPRHQIGTRVHKESEPGPTPSHQGPAQPLQNLPQIIWATNPLKQPTPRYPVPTPFLFQTHQQIIRPNIHGRAAPENHHTAPHSPPEPPITIEISVLRHPSSLQISVQQIKPESHESHAHRKTGFLDLPAMASEEEPEGVDERAVDVVEEEDGDEEEGAWVSAVSAVGEEEESEPYGGAFH